MSLAVDLPPAADRSVDPADLTDLDFGQLLACAHEIVLPVSPATALPLPRRGAWYDVTTQCVDLTEGMPAYGG